MKPVVSLLVLTGFVSWVTCDVSAETNEADLQARIFLYNFDKRYRNVTTAVVNKKWVYHQNATDKSKKEYVEETTIRDRLSRILNAQAEQFDLSKVSSYVQRSLKAAISLTSASKLEESKAEELTNILEEMKRIQSMRHDFCLSPTRCFSRTSVPSIWEIFTSQNTTDIAEVWAAYLSSNGRKIKPLYTRYVELKNEAARLQGFKDYGEQWRSNYEQSNLEEDVIRLFDHVKILYRALHTYIKYQLKKIYGAHVFPSSGHIPSPLLYGMYGPHWKGHQYRTLDVSKELKDGRYTIKKVYDAANDFYKSLGFPGMPPSVWGNSSLGLPVKGQNKICSPLSWDFHDRRDFRMSMCASESHIHLKLVYQVMGHLVYFQENSYQPIYFQGSADEAFHAAVGEIMGMSALSPEYLKKMELISRNHNHDVVGFLLGEALRSLLPIANLLIVDLFRWRVFNGSITPENYNKEWWRLMCKYYGLSPAANRSQDDFDASGVYHMIEDVPYIRYYIGTFLRYNLYEQACRDKGHKGDLHLCDISGSKLVGAKFRNLMREGSSRHWKDLLRQFTGSENINPESIITYFKPLYTFLVNNSGDEPSGWNDECDPYLTVDW